MRKAGIYNFGNIDMYVFYLFFFVQETEIFCARSQAKFAYFSLNPVRYKSPTMHAVSIRFNKNRFVYTAYSAEKMRVRVIYMGTAAVTVRA